MGHGAFLVDQAMEMQVLRLRYDFAQDDKFMNKARA
jgi:hypothetical protein